MPTAIRVVDQFVDLADTPATYSGQTGLFARVNAGETALEFAAVAGGITTFLGLTDTPASFSGAGSQLVRVNAGATALEFLDPASDFATQYALLAGRAGGSTLYGGIGANDDLTLEPTSHATKTTAYVLLAPSGGNVGIGTASPGGLLEVNKSQNANTLVNVINSNAGSSARAGMQAQNDLSNGLFFQIEGSNFNLGAGYELLAADSGVFGTGGANGMRLITSVSAPIIFGTGGYATVNERMRITSTGNVGIGTTGPDTLFHALLTDAGTAAIVNVLTVGHESSGTPAAGFGAGLHLTLESSTTAKQSAALLAASWIVATHASRTARLALSAYDSGGAREGIRIDADGSEARLGFYGVTATARQLLATGAGTTVDQVITALQTLGLLKQS